VVATGADWPPWVLWYGHRLRFKSLGGGHRALKKLSIFDFFDGCNGHTNWVLNQAWVFVGDSLSDPVQ